ncbi:MAG: hypothetical protein LC135_15110 [Phycisphaerae bacterium]|jgi:hypothetical protein|nr:hypothetical protein [Phycisphaerae bacterium]MCZ2401171.1 hypothetical protein [Phycisphaerae bacterium]
MSYAELSLLIFFAVFIAVLVRVTLYPQASVRRFARLPLDDGESPGAEAGEHGGRAARARREHES